MSAFIAEPCDESVIRSAPAAAPCPKQEGRWVLVATVLASSMAFIDSTVVNVELPRLQPTPTPTTVACRGALGGSFCCLPALPLSGGSRVDHGARGGFF